MQSIFDAITEWLKGLLVEGIMGNLGGLFTNVNEQVGEIAAQVGTSPAARGRAGGGGAPQTKILKIFSNIY